MPQGLDYPRGTDFWVPLTPATPQARLSQREVFILARNALHATQSEPQQELAAFLHRPGASEFERTQTALATSLPTLILGDTKLAMIVFAIASAQSPLVVSPNQNPDRVTCMQTRPTQEASE